MSVTIARLESAHRKVAELLLADRISAPIFLRLEQEIAALKAEKDVVARARAIVQLHKATA